MDASAEVNRHTGTYFDIRIWSAPAVLVNYAVLGWLLGVQRAGTALYLQVLLNGLNILLDLVFVLGLEWGVAGVAWATLIAEAVAAGIGLTVIFAGQGGLPGAAVLARLRDPARLGALLRVNIDIFLRTLCLVLAFAVFTSDSAGLGDVVLAGNAILIQIQSLIAHGLDGFAHAAEILAGSSLGARNRRTFRKAVVVCSLWGLGAAAILSLALWLAGPSLIALFTSLPEVRISAGAYLGWMIFSPLVAVWSYLLDGIFIGATRTAAMRNAMLLSLAIFLGIKWLLLPALGNHGLWLSLLLFLAARAITLGAYYPALEASVAPKTGSGRREV
jgi:MATE family multidrug resistance protein